MSSKALQMKEPWYSEGVRFKCTQCGQCCTGSPGYTWVSEEEIQQIAAFLHLSIQEFARRYLRRVGDRFSLLENSKNFDCIFLHQKKCQIYPVRPKQCKTFPWWPKTLKSQEEWEAAGKFCEGINHPEAPITPYSIIQEQLTIQES